MRDLISHLLIIIEPNLRMLIRDLVIFRQMVIDLIEIMLLLIRNKGKLHTRRNKNNSEQAEEDSMVRDLGLVKLAHNYSVVASILKDHP